MGGFAHNDDIHQYTFFDAHNMCCIQKSGDCARSSSSLNTLGYSPYELKETIRNVETIVQETAGKMGSKAFILSVTGTEKELAECYGMIVKLQEKIPDTPLYMEVNLSCPNISGKPPPAYNAEALKSYLLALAQAQAVWREVAPVPIGIKTPPYSNPENFKMLEDVLRSLSEDGAPIAFITATNTLGCSLVLNNDQTSALSSGDGLGMGGMAGAALHPLSLGNVKMLRQLLDRHENLKSIHVIGIGGISDAAGFQRMKSVGASDVGVGTALGRKGVSVFEEIWKAINHI